MESATSATAEPSDAPAIFRELTVASRRPVAHDVVEFELIDPSGRDLPAWTPGAHLDVCLPSGLVRQYSLCGPVDDRARFVIAVLKVKDSRGGSQEIHESLQTGASLKVFGPRNDFELVDAPSYLLLGGGIGITPIVAMARELARRGRPWTLIYGAETFEHMAYREELEAIAEGRIELVPRNQRGLPDLGGALRSQAQGCAVYCCGPEPMLQRVERLCAPRSEQLELHLERFVEAIDVPSPVRPDDEAFDVELRAHGSTLTVGADQTLLAAVREILPTHPFSCLKGECGTCMARVIAGAIDHRDTVLTEQDHARGTHMMLCVSRAAKGDRLVLDI